jgi:hypothetical protein
MRSGRERIRKDDIHPLNLPEIAKLHQYYKQGTTILIAGEENHLDPGQRNQKVMRVIRRMLTKLYRDRLSVG